MELFREETGFLQKSPLIGSHIRSPPLTACDTGDSASVTIAAGTLSHTSRETGAHMEA
jgi:hypothetical protein